MDSKRTWGILILVLIAIGVVAWLIRTGQRPSAARVAAPIGQRVEIKAPLGLPPVPIPADNPPTAETIELGRRLYYDPILSVDHSTSCASCHSPGVGFSDPRQFSEGFRNQKGNRHSPPVVNAAYFEFQFWDGRAPTLEKQAEGPVQNPVEMAHTLDGAVKKLEADPSYRAAFAKAFGPGPITYDMVSKSIASFERTVVSGNSPFDRYYYGGDKSALNGSARRGLEVFRDPKKGNCVSCHTIGDKYALFTDNKFHNIGIGVVNEEPVDVGRYAVTQNEADRGAFKTPSLRNVAERGPYFHDGSRKTLKDAIDFYIGGGNSNSNLDKEIHALDFLSGQERKDLQAFLESLTGEMPPNSGPPERPKEQTRLR